MTSVQNRLFDDKGLAIDWIPPFSNDRQLLEARGDFFKNKENKSFPYITSEYNDFINAFQQSLLSHQYIKIKGLDLFTQRDVITGCQHFIDQIIMTHGLQNIQVFKGGYHYYRKLNPEFAHVDLESMMPGKPLILEYPFPSSGDRHPQYNEIISRADDMGIDVYLDCAWLPCAWEQELDLRPQCIKGMATSLSKPFGMHWCRIGVRWLKHETNDTIKIENQYRMVSYPNVMIGKYYLDKFPMDYLITKYKKNYYDLCNSHDLEPLKTLVSAYSRENKGMVGVANLLLNND